jgi:hypothetical protein
MGRGSLVLSMVVAACIGSLAWGQKSGRSPSEYTTPARAQLFTGTLAGLTEAYRVLDRGVNDSTVTGDKRELILLHVVARTGMLVFDRDNVSVKTSLLEIAQPLGITITGDVLFSDPAKVRLHLPTDPNNPDCLQIPAGADLDAAAAAINTAILPEIDLILAELGTVSDGPTAFSMTLTTSETGLSSPVEVDYGDVLLLKAALLAAKALLYGAANPAHDLTVDLNDPIFTGWQCGSLPASTTVAAILNTYPRLLDILPTVGVDRLSQAKRNLAATVDAAISAIDYVVAETDDQEDDLFHIHGTDAGAAAVRSDLDKLRASLANGTAQAYTRGSKQVFTLRQAGVTVGQMNLDYDMLADERSGPMELPGVQGVPPRWAIDWFDVYDTRMQAQAWTTEGSWWGWFDGTISADGSQITDLTFDYWGPGAQPSERIGPLTAQRTSDEPVTVTLDPNPLFTGRVTPRNMLPAFDTSNMPVPGTFGHGLGDDATLGGITPGLTQDDWLRGGYEVYGVADPNELIGTVPESAVEVTEFLRHIDQQSDVLTKLGVSAGQTATFSGQYPLYIIAARSRVLVDSLHGPANDYLGAPEDVLMANLSAFGGDIEDAVMFFGDAVIGPPDGTCAALGELGMFGRFTGWAMVNNSHAWTALTVVTKVNEKVPVYRFWSPSLECHFYTISEEEKDNLIRDYPHIWTFEGTAYFAMRDSGSSGAVPVYRFWSPVYSGHFYTISETEKDMLIRDFQAVWTFEGTAFYAYPEGRQPADAKPVYRFWSPVTGHHFYTISEEEKNNLIRDYSYIWTLEGVAWYAYPP